MSLAGELGLLRALQSSDSGVFPIERVQAKGLASFVITPQHSPFSKRIMHRTRRRARGLRNTYH